LGKGGREWREPSGGGGHDLEEGGWERGSLRQKYRRIMPYCKIFCNPKSAK